MIKPLTSLRFFFAFIVFLSHLEWVPKIDKSFSELYDNIFSKGYIGVSFFFMLSGFILALNYKEKILKKEISFKEFWVSRIARIYPLHLFTLCYSLIFFLPDLFKQPFFWLKSFTANLLLLQSFFPDEKVYFGFNAVSWSISNELFFYLMFPVLLIILYKYPKSIHLMFLFFLLIPVGIYFTPKIHQIFLFSVNPMVRIADFIFGILLYKLFELKFYSTWFEKRIAASFLEVTAILLFISFFALHDQVPFGYRFSIYYWIPMAGIIYAFAHAAGFFSRILSTRLLVFLGEISFGFYMLHPFVMRSINAVERRMDYAPNLYLWVGGIFTATLICSVFSYYYLELPSNRRIRNWYRKNKILNPAPVLFEEEKEVLSN